MPVDFGGMPCDYEQINALAVKHPRFFVPGATTGKTWRILVLSDSAHLGGASVNGKKLEASPMRVCFFLKPKYSRGRHCA